jgi:hypothetical protein
MHCLSNEESRGILSSTALAIGESGRIGLAKAMNRIEARPVGDIAELGSDLDFIFRWLPPGAGRLFCICDWGSGALAQPYSFVMAARHGVGEARPLLDAPVHHFPALSWTWDALEESEAQRQESGLLAGLTISTMCFGWDALLVAENSDDVIEFWEGNILFYSPDDKKIEEAKALLKERRYPLQMK